MSSAVVKKHRFKRDQKYVIEKIAEIREELEELIDYVDLLEARALNFGAPKYTTKQVKETLKIS
jgi:hypothetical protein